MIHTLVLSSDFPAFTAVKTTQTLICEWDLQTYCHLCSSELSFFHPDVQIQPRPALMWLHQMVKDVLSGLVLSVWDVLRVQCYEQTFISNSRVTTEQCVWKYKYDMPYFIYFLFFWHFLTTSERFYHQMFNRGTVALRDVSAGFQSPAVQCIWTDAGYKVSCLPKVKKRHHCVC